MESHDDNPELVDLLYDDELDEETAERLRAKVEESPDERAALESYDQMLSRIRDEEPTEEVPDGIHDSIMEAAEEAADERSEAAHPESAPDGARTERRTPSSSTGSRGIWKRISESITTSQVALAAVALLAGGTVLYMLRATPYEPTSPASQPAGPPAGETSEEPPAKSAEAPETPAKQPGGESEGSATSTDEAGAPDEPLGSPEAGPEQPESTPGEKKKQAAQPDTPIGGESRKRRARRDEVVGSDSDDLNGFGDESEDDAPSASGSSASDSAGSSGAGEELKARGTAPEESAESRPSLNLGDSDPFKGGESGSTGSEANEQAEKKPAAGEKPGDASEASPSEEEQRERDEVPTLEDVRRAYRNNDWQKTVRRASALLRTSSVDDVDKPRVLELKARALENQGHVQEAHSAYSRLREEYPDFKSSTIETAAKRNARKRKRAREKRSQEAEKTGSETGSKSGKTEPPKSTSDEAASEVQPPPLEE